MMFLTSETCFVDGRRSIYASGCINACPESQKRLKSLGTYHGEAVGIAMHPRSLTHIRRALAQGVSDHLLFVFIATFVTSVKQLVHFLKFVATFCASV